MRTVVYGVSVYDWPSIAAVIATLLLITLVATAVPTLRITVIDQAKTLRDEQNRTAAVLGRPGDYEKRHSDARFSGCIRPATHLICVN
jgi:hypothetical protein